jgi:hypothetical protein
MKKPVDPDEVRSNLITFAVVLSYVVFAVIGMIIAKYRPAILDYLDYAFFPIGLATILFLYLFSQTYERKRRIEVTDEVNECARLYGEGKSFNEIKDEMELSSTSDVKRMITKFCELKGVNKNEK